MTAPDHRIPKDCHSLLMLMLMLMLGVPGDALACGRPPLTVAWALPALAFGLSMAASLFAGTAGLVWIVRRFWTADGSPRQGMLAVAATVYAPIMAILLGLTGSFVVPAFEGFFLAFDAHLPLITWALVTWPTALWLPTLVLCYVAARRPNMVRQGRSMPTFSVALACLYAIVVWAMYAPALSIC